MGEVKSKKGTATGNVEYVLGNGAASLNRAVSEVSKVLESVKEAAREAEKVTNEVATKKAELDSLTTKFQETERQMILDLEMKIRENKKSVVTEALLEFNQVPIESDELHNLREELVGYKTEFDAKVNAEVGKVKADDSLADVETDKATMEVVGYEAGTLLYIGVKEGEAALVNGIIAIVGKEGTGIVR